MVAYNHEKYIGQAIESVLSQKTTFPFELVISEDYSTDRTRAIVIDYARRYPAIIQPVLGERNIGAARNYMRAISACRGEYIAMMDSDDYWTNDDKLQQQADFLDAHPDYSTCFHSSVKVREQDGTWEASALWNENWRNVPRGAKAAYTLEDVLAGSFLATSATMFRRGLFGAFPAWFGRHFYVADHALHALNAEHGPFGYIDQDMSVYREHSAGIWSGGNLLRHHKALADLYEDLNRHFGHKYARLCKCSARHVRVATMYLLLDDRPNARKYIRKAVRAYPRDRATPFSKLAGTALSIYAPRLYRLALSAKARLKPTTRGRPKPTPPPQSAP
jgi:glycosyltransferase involved in cell wall biosynthesis